MIRVLLVDDHPLVLEGLRGLMEAEADVEVVATTTQGDYVADLVRLHRPDVVVLDLELGDVSGFEVLKRLKAQPVPARVLVLTAYGDGESMRAAIEHEADGIALKTDSPARTIDALRAVSSGALVYPQAARRWMRNPAERSTFGPGALSEREREVWALLASGLSNRVIARKLGVSPSTVKFHTQNLFQKLGVNNRTAAAVEYEKQIPAAARAALTPSSRTPPPRN
ncbi:MAG TPA: response regulator transcription factor [Gemmatimonadaceae bacterium]|jgi:DNA-binding NarL/FixJ family response regulator|nr:response regulator transcription factor [Gemmatimonadaceae bacterium]